MTKENLTEIVAIVDRSGSMAGLTNDVIGGFNQFLADQKKEPGEANLTLATFASDYTLLHDAVPLASVPNLDHSTYRPAGGTSLLDAIGKTVKAIGNRLRALEEDARPSKIVILIMTDGDENSSQEFEHKQVMEMISHQQDKYNWQFIYIGANQDAIKAGASIGISATSSYGYTATSAGTHKLYGNMSKGVSTFRKSAAGSSYTMQDPSKLDAVDLTQPTTSIDVDKENSSENKS